MKILSTLILTAMVAITLKRFKTEFLLVKVDDMVNTGKFLFNSILLIDKIDIILWSILKYVLALSIIYHV